MWIKPATAAIEILTVSHTSVILRATAVVVSLTMWYWPATTTTAEMPLAPTLLPSDPDVEVSLYTTETHSLDFYCVAGVSL